MIYLHKNGVTVVAEKTAKVGQWYKLNGEEYLVVDRKILGDLVSKGKDVTKVVTTKVKIMLQLFSNKNSFNQNIGSWDVSNVESMSYMFYNAKKFNQDLSNWDTSKVYQMESMFEGAKSFNSNIEKWNTKSCCNFRNMFSGAYSFNQPIGAWNINGNISGMFKNAKSFNQSINDWNVKGVDSMISLFEGAESFNQDLNSWKLPNGYWQGFSLNKMFKNALKFNGNIASWEFKDEARMDEMFCGATSFNQDISNWDMGNVVKMDRMFNKAISFNHDLSNWNINEKLKQKPPSGIFTGAKKMKPEFSPFNKTKRTIDKSYLRLSDIDKKTITKIKKLLTSRDIGKIDLAVELIISLNNYELFNFLLDRCKLETLEADVNEVGDLNYFNSVLHTNKFFTGTGPSQPFLNYALMSIVSNLPQNQNIEVDESLYIKNISRLNLSTLLSSAKTDLHGNTYVRGDNLFEKACFDLNKFTSLNKIIIDFHYVGHEITSLYSFKSEYISEVVAINSNGSIKWIEKFNQINYLNLKFTDNNSQKRFGFFDSFKSLKKLEYLILHHNGEFENIDFLNNCSNINSLTLNINNWYGAEKKLNNINVLTLIKNLEILEINGIDSNLDLNPLFNCLNLKELSLKIDDLFDFKYLQNCKYLEKIHLKITSQFSLSRLNLAPLESCNQLLLIDINGEVSSKLNGKIHSINELKSANFPNSIQLNGLIIEQTDLDLNSKNSLNKDINKTNFIKKNQIIIDSAIHKNYIDESKISSIDKNTITKIKNLLTSRDIEKIDLAVEKIISLDNDELFEFLLGGCKLETLETDVNKVGDLNYFNSVLHTNKFFTGTGPSQPFLNYALMSIVSNLPQNQNIEVDESLYIKNISRLNLSTLLEDSYSHKKFVGRCFNLSKFTFLKFLIVDFKCFENDFPYSLNFDNKNVEGLIMDSAVGSLSWLSKFSKIKKLKLKNYPFYPFKDFEVFHNLNDLEDLEIKSSGYTNINFLHNCTKIKSLKLDFSLYSSNDNSKMEDASELENLKNLKYFELVGINEREVINDVLKHITKLNFLDSLNISTDDQTNFCIKVDLRSFHGLKNHFSLKKVKINNLELIPFKTTLFSQTNPVVPLPKKGSNTNSNSFEV